jgi:hypothetical protein
MVTVVAVATGVEVVGNTTLVAPSGIATELGAVATLGSELVKVSTVPPRALPVRNAVFVKLRPPARLAEP